MAVIVFSVIDYLLTLTLTLTVSVFRTMNVFSPVVGVSDVIDQGNLGKLGNHAFAHGSAAFFPHGVLLGPSPPLWSVLSESDSGQMDVHLLPPAQH